MTNLDKLIEEHMHSKKAVFKDDTLECLEIVDDNRLANVCKLLVDALKFYSLHDYKNLAQWREWVDLDEGLVAGKALAEAEKLAGGE